MKEPSLLECMAQKFHNSGHADYQFKVVVSRQGNISACND